jgi:hypothetical protein
MSDLSPIMPERAASRNLPADITAIPTRLSLTFFAALALQRFSEPFVPRREEVPGRRLAIELARRTVRRHGTPEQKRAARVNARKALILCDASVIAYAEPAPVVDLAAYRAARLVAR